MLHVVLLLGCAVAIYLGCEWFVNGVEWLGVRLRVGPLAVGTLLAAAGTALPESVVTLVAVLFGGEAQGDEIGVGAALGGPLVVGTVAYAVTGGMLLWVGRSRRRHAWSEGPTEPVPFPAPVAEPVVAGTGRLTAPVGDGEGAGPAASGADGPGPDGAGPDGPGPDGPGAAGGLGGVDLRRMSRDQIWFLCIFVVKVGLGLVAFAVKPWLGLLFFAAYGVYFRREVSTGDEVATGEDLAPLKLQPRLARPTTAAVLLQTGFTLVLIFGASQLFVRQLEWAGPALGLPAAVVALLLSPVATELPEVMNAIIWVRQGKTELATANLSGAMMIQATVPSGIGLLFTPWRFDTPLLASGLATMASVGYLAWLFRTGRVTPARLVVAIVFYLIFAVVLAVHLA